MINPRFFADVLRALMRRQGIKTQKDLAALFGVSGPRASAWLNPKSRDDVPGDNLLPMIAELSGYDIDQLKKCKIALKWQDKGVDMASIKAAASSLTPEQAEIIQLMEVGDYLGAANVLITRARLSA